MPTITPKLGLPRPVASDNVTLVNQQALIDAIELGTTAYVRTAVSEVTVDLTPYALKAYVDAQIAIAKTYAP